MPSVRGGTMLIMETATPYMHDEWYKLAAAHDMDVVYTKAESQDQFMSEIEGRSVKVLVNAYMEATRMGRYTPEMIERIAKAGVLCVSHEGAGYESLGDIQEWKKWGIQVSNAPDSVAPDTANTGIYLMISAMRHFHQYSKSLRQGNWTKDVPLGMSPAGRTLGILGMGNIGRMVRDRAVPFNFDKIQYHGRTRLAPELEKDSVYVSSLEEFLATSDVIILLVPLNKHTHHLINAERLEQCKDGVVIVNIARGSVIDEDALVKALDSGKVSGVGLDVYEHEPQVHPGLLANEHATLLPHAAPRTEGTRGALERELFKNVRSFLETGSVVNLVPELRK